MAEFFGGNGDGGITATAGTRIQYLILPNARGIARITTLVYVSGATQHALRVLRSIGRTTASANAAAAQANISFLAQPGTTTNLLAANDLIAIQETDGVTRLYTVSAVPGSYPGTVTLTTNLIVGAVVSSKVWNFGIQTDTDPVTGKTHPKFNPTVSATTPYEDLAGGVCAGHEIDSPLLVDSDNVTAAGEIRQLSWWYTGG